MATKQLHPQVSRGLKELDNAQRKESRGETIGREGRPAWAAQCLTHPGKMSYIYHENIVLIHCPGCYPNKALKKGRESNTKTLMVLSGSWNGLEMSEQTNKHRVYHTCCSIYRLKRRGIKVLYTRMACIRRRSEEGQSGFGSRLQ